MFRAVAIVTFWVCLGSLIDSIFSGRLTRVKFKVKGSGRGRPLYTFIFTAYDSGIP
jgi:hypothetical protein